jgi:RHS repeat-associated protein
VDRIYEFQDMPRLGGSGEAGPATLGLLRSEGGVTEQAAIKRKRMEIRPPAYTERIATKRREERTANNYGEERRHVYYYHGDHLGSAQVVTDYRGEVYEHIEYTPYGELWVEHAPNVEATPFRFTGKERDSETGLYYYGARYLNPQTSMWLSTDPAMGEYIPQAPLNDEARRYNQNLLGMGGVYNYINLHAYHYAGNNPVRYIDPDGREIDQAEVNAAFQEWIKIRDPALARADFDVHVFMDNQAVGKNGRIPSVAELNEYAKGVIEAQKTYSIIVTVGLLFCGLFDWLNAPKGFKINGELKTIFGNRHLFLNWLRGNQSLTRKANPLNDTEAQQLIDTAKNLNLVINSNSNGLAGIETTGAWAGIAHFKIGNIHIPIQKGLGNVLKF